MSTFLPNRSPQKSQPYAPSCQRGNHSNTDCPSRCDSFCHPCEPICPPVCGPACPPICPPIYPPIYPPICPPCPPQQFPVVVCGPACPPIYPPICPPCPPQQFPVVVCTPGFESFSAQSAQTAVTPVSIPNAFNTNDGPAPYTVLQAEFIDLQLPLSNLLFTPQGCNNFILSAAVLPMVLVRYLDGNSTQRTKFVQAPLQLFTPVTVTANPNAVNWWAFMTSGSISNPILSGTTLSFTASGNFDIIGISDDLVNSAVLRDFTSAQQAPITADCHSIYEPLSFCQISATIPGSSQIAIPFAPLGPAPYSAPTATSLGGQPYVLRVVNQSDNSAILDLAFPIILIYQDSSAQLQTQMTFLFMTLVVRGVASTPNARIIANLTLSNIQLSPQSFTTSPLSIQSLTLTGYIAAIGSRRNVLTTDIVQCGAVPAASTCQPILPPPTAEITS